MALTRLPAGRGVEGGDAGVLACLDGYMNIALEQTEEYVNGQLRNKYGDAFIRGNNGMRRLPRGDGRRAEPVLTNAGRCRCLSRMAHSSVH